MAMSTQIIFVSLCCLVADSYSFSLEFYDDEDHFRIPLGLPDPFELYPGMFDPPEYFIKGHHHHKFPLPSEVTTEKKSIEDKAVSTDSPLITTENVENDIFVTEPNIEHDSDPSLKDSLKTDDEAMEPIVEVNGFSHVNTLSIHDEPILSVKIPDDREKRTTEVPKEEVAALVKDTFNDTIKQNTENDPGLTKNTDFLLIPVNAVNPTIINPSLNLNDGSNNLTPMVGTDNGLNFNRDYPMNPMDNANPNGNNNMSPNLVYANPNLGNSLPYGNQPIQYGNSINPQYNVPNQVIPNNPKLYTMVTIPNNMQGNNIQPVPNSNNNLYYLNNGNPNMVQATSPQMYNLIPINNFPNNLGASQPNNFYPNNQPNNFVPNYNQPMNGAYNNVPNNYVPINQPNTFTPANNNYIPVNNQPNNFIPLNNNNPNNFPINQPNNYIPYYNNQPNNFNGQPNNFVPNNFNNQPNNFVANNNFPNNFVPYQGNFIPFKDQNNVAAVNNDGTSQPQPQPIVALVALNEKDNGVSSTTKSDEQKDKELIVAEDN